MTLVTTLVVLATVASLAQTIQIKTTSQTGVLGRAIAKYSVDRDESSVRAILTPIIGEGMHPNQGNSSQRIPLNGRQTEFLILGKNWIIEVQDQDAIIGVWEQGANLLEKVMPDTLNVTHRSDWAPMSRAQALAGLGLDRDLALHYLPYVTLKNSNGKISTERVPRELAHLTSSLPRHLVSAGTVEIVEYRVFQAK